MIQKAYRMKLRVEGAIADYEKAHNPIPPELRAALRGHGVREFTIFHHPGTLDLFASVEIEDEDRFRALADLQVCRDWWKEMTRHLACENPGDAKAIETPLRKVFSFRTDPDAEQSGNRKAGDGTWEPDRRPPSAGTAGK